MKIVNEHTPGSAQFKDVLFGGVFYSNDISNVYIKTFDTLHIQRMKPCGYGEIEFVYEPVNAISVKEAFATFFTDDAVVTPLPNSFLTLK